MTLTCTQIALISSKQRIGKREMRPLESKPRNFDMDCDTDSKSVNVVNPIVKIILKFGECFKVNGRKWKNEKQKSTPNQLYKSEFPPNTFY